MSDTIHEENAVLAPGERPNLAPVVDEDGVHTSSGALGEIAGTGTGALSGAIIGTVAGGPVGTVIGAIAGGVLGDAAGQSAHHMGDDHDDQNLSTGSGGILGRESGAGAGALSGAVIGTAVGGPAGGLVGAVAVGMLGTAAGDAAKNFGEGETMPVDTVSRADNNYGVGAPTDVVDTNVGIVSPDAPTINQGDGTDVIIVEPCSDDD